MDSAPYYEPKYFGHSLEDFQPKYRNYFEANPWSFGRHYLRYFMLPKGGGGNTGQGDFRSWRHLRPDGKMYAIVQVPGCDLMEARVPLASPGQSFSPGQFVSVGVGQHGASIIGQAPSGLIGAGGFALLNPPDADMYSLEINRSVPSTFTAGSTGLVVDIYGHGFLESPTDEFTWVQLNVATAEWEDDPMMTVNSVTWVDATHVVLNIDVDSAAPNNRILNLRAERA